jgi:hypothetical protein
LQLASRKQFIEYKLKLATRTGPDGTSVTTGVSPADRAALIAELTEVQANSEALIRQYERRFGEAYGKVGTDGPGSVPASPAAAGKEGVSWESGTAGHAVQASPRASFASSHSQSAASTPFANNVPHARHSITLPNNSNATSTPTYMSPLLSRNTAANAGTPGANKSAFKSVPPAR